MGGNESCHLYGLSYHCVTSVEEATKLYILGVANRMTAETPDNQRSFRSHAVFSIMIFRQKHGTEIFVRCVFKSCLRFSVIELVAQFIV